MAVTSDAHQCKQQVPVRSKQIYANLETYFDGTQNLTVYRDALAESHLPAIPMLGSW